MRIQVQTNTGSVTALFCIYVEAYNSANMTITCGPSLTTFTPSTPSASTSLLSTSTAAITTITTTQSTQSTNSVASTHSDQKTNNTIIEDTELTSTTTGIHVVIPSTTGGVGLVLVVLVIVVCIRKRKLNKDKSKSNRSKELRQYDNKGMENEDKDEMRVNIFYESYDDAPKKENQHVFDDIGGGYSEVGLIQTTDQRKTYHKKDDGYSEVKLQSAERRESKFSDQSGYSEGINPIKEKRNIEDISGAYDEVKLSSNKTNESKNDVLKQKSGDEVKFAKTCDFPIYCMPNKSSKKTTNTELLTDSFPIYALPDKKKKPDNETKSNTGGAVKPIIKPKPMMKAKQLPTNQDHADIVNGDGLKYSDVQFQENNPTKRKPFLPVQKQNMLKYYSTTVKFAKV